MTTTSRASEPLRSTTRSAPSDAAGGFRAPYRPELEGLRAVAILLVAVSHLWWGRISGGIDVFLVVSGYLITVTLVMRWIRSGEVGAVRYLRSLGARLIPAVILVLGTVVVVTVTTILPTRPALAADVLGSAGWSALFGQNWFLALTTDGYLSADRVLNPAEHFWALSMQMQFYVIWLLLVALLSAGLRRRGTPQRRFRIAVTAIVTIVAASWAWSIIETLRNQPLAYLDTSARIWEFGVGGLLALLGAKLVPTRLWGTILGWLGLAMIVALGFIGDFDPYFPGIASPWPVIGTALVLVGANSGSGFGPHRLLGSKPGVWFGGLAFGLYLWHWPIISAFAIFQNRRSLSVVEGVTLVLAALIIAWVMKHALEQPWQRWGRRSPAAATLAVVLVIALGASSLALSAGAAATASRPRSSPTSAPPPTTAQASPDAIEYLDPPEVFPDTATLARAITAATQWSSIPDGVLSDADAAQPALGEAHCVHENWASACVSGAADAPHTAVVLGDSVAAGWQPALAAALGPDWRVVLATQGACPAADVASFNDGGTDPAWVAYCAAVRADMIAGIRATQPELVVLTSSSRTLDRLVSGATGAAAREEWRVGVDSTLQQLSGLRSRIVVLAPPPLSVLSCGSADFEPGGSRCHVPLTEEWRAQASTEKAVAAEHGAGYIDSRGWFCTAAAECPWAIDGSVARMDTHHLTAEYSARLAAVLRTALLDAEPALPDVGPRAAAPVQ